MTHDRTVGVTILAVLTGVRALYGIFQATLLLAVAAKITGSAGAVAVLMAGLLGLLSLVQLVAAGGLLTGSSAGWLLAMVVYGFDAAVGVLLVTSGAAGSGAVIALVIDAFAILVLLGVRSNFSSSANRRESVPDPY